MRQKRAKCSERRAAPEGATYPTCVGACALLWRESPEVRNGFGTYRQEGLLTTWLVFTSYSAGIGWYRAVPTAQEVDRPTADLADGPVTAVEDHQGATD